MTSRPLLLVCLWFAALPALGAGVEFVHPGAGSTLAAGDEVVVRWAGAPAAAEEMELLLSVDGGRHFAVRLTHELSGEATSYLWRVPELPAGAARLTLRANLDGREVEVGESASFAIGAIRAGADFAGPDGSIRFVRGEFWWLDQTVAGSETDGPALAGLDPLPAEPRVLPAAGESMLAEPLSPEGAPRPAAGSKAVPIVHSASLHSATPRPVTGATCSSPLRI